jgi:hypothetical protein
VSCEKFEIGIPSNHVVPVQDLLNVIKLAIQLSVRDVAS